MQRIRLLPLAVVALAAVTWISSTSQAEVAPPPPDPATAALPVRDDADPDKSVVVRMNFSSRTAATVERAAVSVQRAHTHFGDPPILRLRLDDAGGTELATMNAWSPLWVFTNNGKERLELQDSGSGAFVVPFSPNLASMTITDVGLGQEVATVDLEPPIRDFCRANPGDPDCLEADLAVTGVAARAPLFAVLGQPVTVTVDTTVSNLGPDGPVDAEVTRSVTAAGGLTVTPAAPVMSVESGLAVNTPRVLGQNYSVTCTEPGTHFLTFASSVAPRRATVIDGTAANDAATATVPVDCAVPVTIDIKPGGADGSITLNGGVAPVVVFTTAAGEYGNPLAFAATTISPLTVRFASPAVLLAGGGVYESHRKGHLGDAEERGSGVRDGDIDMMLHFGPRSDTLATGDAEGCVFGRFASPSGPMSFYGCDAVRTK